jgi:hypothetical protein
MRLFIVALLAVSSACSPPPKVGDSCAATEGYCSTRTDALNCRGGLLVASSCPAGCVGPGICNYTQNAIGDPCFDPKEGGPTAEGSLSNTSQCRAIDTHVTLSCEDGCANAAALVCTGGQLREIPCRGSGGCVSKLKGAGLAYQCDGSAANGGEPCLSRDEGFGSCGASNEKEILTCRSGAWTVTQSCPDRCSMKDGRLGCGL